MPALLAPADLAHQALLKADDLQPSPATLSWRRCMRAHGQPVLAPRRWIYLNYAHQQVQGALAGQGA